MERPPLSLRRTDVTRLVASVENRWSGAVIAALLPLVAAVLLSTLPSSALEKQPLTFVTGAGPHAISVEVADNDAERSTGLMFRRSIGPNEGMLFIYDHEEDISMWMKNTYIPLDMFFVKSDGVIAQIEANTEPFSEAIIAAKAPVLAVIEMAAGSAKRLGIRPGDRVQHPAFK